MYLNFLGIGKCANHFEPPTGGASFPFVKTCLIGALDLPSFTKLIVIPVEVSNSSIGQFYIDWELVS